MTFTDLDLEAAELAFALWSAEDAPTLDDAALLALDIIDTIGDYAVEWDLDSHEWQLAVALAQQVQP